MLVVKRNVVFECMVCYHQLGWRSIFKEIASPHTSHPKNKEKNVYLVPKHKEETKCDFLVAVVKSNIADVASKWNVWKSPFIYII